MRGSLLAWPAIWALGLELGEEMKMAENVRGMSRASRTAIAGLALGGSLLVATSVSARPGTPNHEFSWSTGPHEMSVRWQNTADESGIVFDIQGQGGDPSVNNWNPGHVGSATILTYTFTNLQNGYHCFRIWSRVGVQGLRSELPTAWTCTQVGPEVSHPRH